MAIKHMDWYFGSRAGKNVDPFDSYVRADRHPILRDRTIAAPYIKHAYIRRQHITYHIAKNA